MKKILIAVVFVVAASGQVLAGSGYDSCIKEERALRDKEVSSCSGMSYLLNPSACFATQKALKEYKAGKCRQIGGAEQVDPGVHSATSEKKASAPVRDVKASDTSGAAVPAVSKPAPIVEKKAEVEVPRQVVTFEQLKEENARLKGEISRLKSENEQLRKSGR